MPSWPFPDAERLRAMYPGGRANPTARRLSRLWAAAFRLGLFPRRFDRAGEVGSGKEIDFDRSGSFGPNVNLDFRFISFGVALSASH